MPTDSLWSDEPPSETLTGCFWMKHVSGLERVFDAYDAVQNAAWYAKNGWKFGPVIPSPEELAAADKRIAELERERIGLLHTLSVIADRDIRDHDNYKAMADWCVAVASSENPKERLAKP